MTKITLLLLFVSTAFGARAQGEVQERDSLKVHYSIYFDWNKIYANAEQTKTLHEVGRWLQSSDTDVILIGSADASYNAEGGKRVAEARANGVAEWLKMKYNISPERITVKGGGIDPTSSADKARRVDVVELIVESEELGVEPEQQPMEDMTVSEELGVESEELGVKPEQQPMEDMTVSEELGVESEKLGVEPEQQPMEDMTVSVEVVDITEQKLLTPNSSLLTIRTNLLYFAGGLFNIGAEYQGANSNFGYLINGGYSPFGNTNWNKNLGGWFVAPEVRYYLPCNNNWFVGAQFLAGGYNIKLSDTGRQGTVIAGGVTGGYKLTLNERFDMDFSLGLGYGSLNYDTYIHTEKDDNIRTATGINKNTIMPIQAGVSLGGF